MGEWVELGIASTNGHVFLFHAYDMWGQGLNGGQLNPHSLHAVQALADGPI
jgi:hypothetical protein